MGELTASDNSKMPRAPFRKGPSSSLFHGCKVKTTLSDGCYFLSRSKQASLKVLQAQYQFTELEEVVVTNQGFDSKSNFR